MKNMSFKLLIYSAVIALLAAQRLGVEAQSCQPSGHLRGRKPPPGKCKRGNDSECCKEGKMYPMYKCSPPVSNHNKAMLTINSFEKGKDGGGPSECDRQYHSDSIPIVALSTGWFNHKTRCHHNITINGNGRSVRAMVVDECDSAKGCDAAHDYQPPCDNNIVDASQAVWKALGVPRDSGKWGWMEITWSNAK
ncbi:kiwellin-1-like [Punica granatum]|nr:kiwellin-1-like [Punica granatum]